MSKLLNVLHECRLRDDRGMMADLRCILVENKKHRAWPALHRLGVGIDEEVKSFIAGLYATHPEATSTGNFGTTCKEIETARNESASDSKLTPTERRFQYLLAARTKDELRDRVHVMVRMAKTQNISVNYGQLEKDLTNWFKGWGDSIRTKWAAKFWTPSVDSTDEEES